MGRFNICPPEQLEGHDADARSDIFALGAVLYEMATGKRAFEGKTVASTIAAILASEPAPITSLQPMSPPELERMVRTCLAKDPDDRFQTVHDLKLQLRWLGDSGELPAQVPHNLLEGHKWSPSRFAPSQCWRSECWQSPISAAPIRHDPSRAQRSCLRRMRISFPWTSTPGLQFFRRMASCWPPRCATRAVRFRFGFGLWTLPTAGSYLGQKAAECLSGRRMTGPSDFLPGGKLKRIDVDGGSLQNLCDVSLAPRGGSWSRNGVILFTPNVDTPLYRIPATGGTAVAVTALDNSRGDKSHRWPQFLPDGVHYLYLGRTIDREHMGVYLGSLDSKEHRLLVNTGFAGVYAAGYLLFMKNQTLFAQPFDAAKAELQSEAISLPDRVAEISSISAAVFTASQNGTLVYYSSAIAEPGWDIVWRDRTGKTFDSLAHGFFTRPAISPDSTKVAVSMYDEQ